VAAKEFGIPDAAEWDMPIGVANEVKDVAKKNENIIRRFLKAQYDLTQEYFQKKGISKITLYRGIKEFIRHDIKDSTFPSENGFVASIKLRPLSSWTTSIGVANRFRNIDNGKMFRKEFDVKDIFSTPGTGVGCLPEEEFVTLGGIVRGVDVSGDYKVEQLRVVFPSPEPQPITYKQDSASDFMPNYSPKNEDDGDISSNVPEPKKLGKDYKKREKLFTKYKEAREAFEKAYKDALKKKKATVATSPFPYEYDENQNLKPNLRLISFFGKDFYKTVENYADSLNAIQDFDREFIESKFELSIGDLIPTPKSRSERTSPGDYWNGLKNVSSDKTSNIYWWGVSETQRQVLASTVPGRYTYNKSLNPKLLSGISALISKSTLKSDTQLHRGEWLPESIVDSVEVGDSIYFDNIQELSLSSDVPNRQLLHRNGNRLDSPYYFNKGKKPAVLRLNCPKGMNALYIKNQADEFENYNNIDLERDKADAMSQAVLLRPDVKMNLVSKTEKDGVTYLEFDVEPKTKEEINNDVSGLVKKDGTLIEEPVLDNSSSNRVGRLPDDLNLPINNSPYIDIPPSEDEEESDEINIFDLENPDYSAPGFYKFEIAKNLAETDEMGEVSDSEIVDLSDWFNLFSTDELEWGDDGKRTVGSIRLLSLDRSEFGEGEWGGDYEFSDLLYDIEQNIRFGGVEPFKKGSVLKRVMDGYIDGEDPAISKEELAQFFKDYSKHFDEDITDSYLVPSIEDQQFMRLLREEVASNLIHVWAETSNGDHPMSHALQDIAKDVLGVEDSAEWNDGTTGEAKKDFKDAVSEIKKQYGEALTALVKAQYRLTQEWLEERGIEKLVVYRGVKEPRGVESKQGLVQLRPLSSWSQNQREALKFTGGTPNPTGGMLRTVIDAKDVFSTPFTGFGCLEEDEIVVIGGKKSAEMRPVKDVWGGWTDKLENNDDNSPISNSPMMNFGPKKGKGGDGRAKEIERRQRQIQQQQEQLARRLEEEEAATENIRGQVEADKEVLKEQIPQIAQMLPTNIEDLFDPNHPLNVLNSRDITEDIFGIPGVPDMKRPSSALVLEPDQNWKDLVKNLESLGLSNAKEIENKVNKELNAEIRDITRKRKNASESKERLENSLVRVERSVKALEDEMIINNFGLNTASSDPDVSNFMALIGGLKSNYMSWAEEYYHLKSGQADILTSSPLYELVRMLHPDQRSWSKILGGANSQLNEIGKLQDSNERARGYDRVLAKVALGTYLTTDRNVFERNLEKLHKEKYVEVMLGRKVSKGIVDSAIAQLGIQHTEWFSDTEKLSNATEDFSRKVSKIIKEKLKELGVEFEHDIEISASDINYIGTGAISLQKLAEGRPESEWWTSGSAGIGMHLKTASSYASILTEALQAFPRPIATIIQKFIVEHPEIKFFGSTRGGFGHVPKDQNLDEVKNIDPKDRHLTFQLDGDTKQASVITASHELTHLLVTQILPQLQPVEWAVLSSLINQTDANGKVKHDLIGGNTGSVLLGGELRSAYPVDTRTLVNVSEPSGYTPKISTPYSTKYQSYGGLGVKGGNVVGLMPYGHGELLSTMTESMLNGSNQVFYGQRGVSPGDKVRIGYNADGTVKYFTIPESPIFNTGVLPVSLAIALLMNELAKQQLGVK